jgi:glycine/sarcosine N-methyltransferase
MSIFQDMSDVFEAMIDWPKRLANEAPFYRRLFEQHGVHSLVDAACGTGHHAAMFHSWNLRIEGADISPAMIDRARANFGEPAGLRWSVRGYDQPIAPAEPLEAVVCVGNSLPLAPDMATVHRAVGQMLAAVRPGGVLIVHALNVWRMPDGPCVWQKCQRAALSQGDVIIVKGVHRCGAHGYVELLVVDPKAAAMQTESATMLGLETAELESIARAAGARTVQFFGGYHDEPYDRAQSVDLLMVATK